MVFKIKIKERGFTLIELLVVIAIIGLLSTLAIVALGSARQKSRDARRLSDLKSIQTALEMYAGDNGGYPASTSIQLGDANHVCFNSSGFNPAGCANPYLAKIPVDPGNGYYQYSGSGNNYAVMGYLEGVVNGLSKAVAVTPNSGLSAYDFTYGLVGWWKFDGTGSDVTVADASGNGNALTVGAVGSNVSWTAGKMGNGLSVLASAKTSATPIPTSAYLNVGSSNIFYNLPQNNFSIAGWYKATAGGTLLKFNTQYSHPGQFNGIWIGNWDCPLANNNSLPTTLPGGIGGIDDTWHQFVYVFDLANLTQRIYRDGVQMSAASNLAGNYGNISVINFGIYEVFWPGSGHAITAILDDYRIYNRALSAAEIQAMYNAQK